MPMIARVSPALSLPSAMLCAAAGLQRRATKGKPQSRSLRAIAVRTGSHILVKLPEDPQRPPDHNQGRENDVRTSVAFSKQPEIQRDFMFCAVLAVHAGG